MKQRLIIYVFLALLSNKVFSQGYVPCNTPTLMGLNSLVEFNGKLILGGYGYNGKYILSYDGISFDTIGITDDSPSIWTMEVYNNDLYVGGEFNTVNGVTVNGIARYDGSSWYALGTGISGGSLLQVEELFVFDGELYQHY